MFQYLSIYWKIQFFEINIFSKDSLPICSTSNICIVSFYFEMIENNGDLFVWCCKEFICAICIWRKKKKLSTNSNCIMFHYYICESYTYQIYILMEILDYWILLFYVMYFYMWKSMNHLEQQFQEFYILFQMYILPELKRKRQPKMRISMD